MIFIAAMTAMVASLARSEEDSSLALEVKVPRARLSKFQDILRRHPGT